MAIQVQTQLRPVEPQRQETDVKLTLPARPENVAVIRHVLSAFAEALQLPDALVEDLRLAVTEACTNVVRHAYPDGSPGPVEVALRPEADVVRVVVADRGRGVGTSSDTSGPGLGLPLIAAVADDVALQSQPNGGSRVAMTFARRRSGEAA
jgi:anti-sigma regulatory factor (Ser/Thr protein kinase)